MPSSDNIAELKSLIRSCALCPRRCGVNRSAGETGACGIAALAKIASTGPHFGEEPVLVGRGGSGTIFFAGCNLDCVYCQNWDISHSDRGENATPDQIAGLALALERRGCENVNFVTPTHVAHAVAEAIFIARSKGLRVPVVYNCGGYEPVDVLRLLDGLVEIYMPDFKYADAAAGKRYSGVPDYPAVAESALAEMYRQVGPLDVVGGVARRGLLVRHLVLPRDIARSGAVVETVARVAPRCAVNIMEQYHPCFRAAHFPELMGRVEPSDVDALREHAAALGLIRVDH